MRRYPPSTIYRYLDLPSTHRIRSHNSHKHNTTPPDPGPIPLHTRHLHHPHHCKPNTDKRPTPLVPTGLVKPKPNPLIHSPPTPPRAKHMHISQLLSSHAPHSPIAGQLRYTQYLNHVYHPHALHSHSLSIHTCNTQKQYTHHSHSNYRIHIGYHDNFILYLWVDNNQPLHLKSSDGMETLTDSKSVMARWS